MIVAAVGLEEFQVTLPVRFCVLASLYVPVAVNCCAVPGATDGFAGVNAIETSAGFTVRLVDPVTLPIFALIVVVPAAAAVTIPPAATVAAPLDELHAAVLVRSFV